MSVGSADISSVSVITRMHPLVSSISSCLLTSHHCSRADPPLPDLPLQICQRHSMGLILVLDVPDHFPDYFSDMNRLIQVNHVWIVFAEGVVHSFHPLAFFLYFMSFLFILPINVILSLF